MPLHTDDPDRDGNLTDEEYWARTRELIDRHGDAGLHVVPPEHLDAAVERARRRGDPDA